MNRNVFLKSFHFLLGIALSVGIPYFGIWIAFEIEYLAAFVFAFLATFFLAIFLSLTQDYKYIGYGMCIGFSLLVIVGYQQLTTIQFP